MTANMKDSLFRDPHHNEKVLSAAANLIAAGVQPFRNFSAQPVPVVTRILTGPPTPTNWAPAQIRLPASPEDPAQRNRFREHPLHSVPGAFNYQLRFLPIKMGPQPGIVYAATGQAAFAASAHDTGAFNGIPRSAVAPQVELPGNERQFKNPTVASATYDGNPSSYGGKPNANAPRGTLVKSNTFNSSDGRTQNRTPSSANSTDANRATRDRQGSSAARSGNNRNNGNANWNGASLGNQNNVAAQKWVNGVTSPAWPANADVPPPPNCPGQDGAVVQNMNWQPYPQSHGQSRANHGSNGQGHRNTTRTPPRGGPRGNNTIAVAASTAQSSQASSGAANQPVSVAVAGPNSSQASDNSSCSSSSPICSAPVENQACSGTESQSPPDSDSAGALTSAEPQQTSEIILERSLSSASPTGASISCECDSGRPNDASSVVAEVASPPDSASVTQTAEWHSASSSPAPASGAVTPTRVSTSNAFGLTFGEFSAEIDEIVNGRTMVPSAISTSCSGDQAKQPDQQPNSIPERSSSSKSTGKSVSGSTSTSVDTAQILPSQSDTVAALESKVVATINEAQDSVPKLRQAVAAAEPLKSAPKFQSPQIVQLAVELQRSFEELQTKAERAHKQVIRFTPQRTCFHHQLESNGTPGADTAAEIGCASGCTPSLV